jgi:transcriptional regulator with XRE-family HTH domain
MPATMPLHTEVHFKLGLNQRETAEICGISLRTVQRWSARQASPSSFDYEKLAAAAFPKDADLAARLASAAGTTLTALGLVPPPPPAPPPAPPAPAMPPPVPQTFGPVELVVDSILCAAAVAMDMKPLEIRPALVAAFRRTRQLGIPAEAVDKALSGEVGGERKAAKAKK